MKHLILISFLLLLQGCGSLVPLPVHGGGKRFAVEQQLLSAASKKSIADFPIQTLAGKKGYINFSIIHDEGGGSFNGGRPFAAEILNLSKITNKSNQATTYESTQIDKSRTSQLGINSNRENGQYIKDSNINSSDGKHFINLFNSYLLRNNVFKMLDGDDPNDADFSLEIIVDVFGTIWRRSDWGVKNSESLEAAVSFEYVISPIKKDSRVPAHVGHSSYQATYKENYFFWMGPSSVTTEIKKSKYGNFVGTLGPIESISTGSKQFSPGFFEEPAGSPIQIFR